MKKKNLKATEILTAIQIMASTGWLLSLFSLLHIQSEISYDYEELPIYEYATQSNIFTVMEHNQIYGYMLLIFAGIVVVASFIRVYFEEDEKDN